MSLNRTDPDLPMLILCAGLTRSGSTWQYNVVRELLRQQRPDLDQYGVWIGGYDPSNRAAVHIVKVHSPEDASALRPVAIVTTYRDLRAVVGSLIRMGWCTSNVDEIDAHLDTYIKTCAEWQSKAQVVSDYREILDDPARCIMKIATGLGMQCSADEAAHILGSIDELYTARSLVNEQRLPYDQVTLLHPGHVGDVADDTAIGRLDPHIIDHIEKRYRTWFIDHGFELHHGGACVGNGN